MARKMTEDFIGTCQWCFGEYKVNGRGDVVLHGYQRPGWGYTVGNCNGVGHQPFEYDHKLTEERIAQLHSDNARIQKQIEAIDAGKVKKIANPSFIPDGDPRKERPAYSSETYHLEYYTPEHRSFDHYLRNMRDGLVRDIDFNNGIITFLDEQVKNWTKKPIVGLDTPATGRPRYLRDAYDPDKAKAAEETAARKAERDARPGKITVNVYAKLPFPDRSLPYSDADWSEMIRKTYDNEAAFKAAIKAWAKNKFTGKLWVGDGDSWEVSRASGLKDYGPGYKIECIAFRPEWSHVEDVMAMFPNAFRCDKDGARDKVTMQAIGKGKDIRLWVSADMLPEFKMPDFS
jgi:hypothetical protein